MKINILFIIILFSSIVTGQNSTTVEPAFELLSKFPNVRDFTISSSGNEGYITIQSLIGEISVLAKIKKVNSIWSEPKIVSFSGKHKDLEPFLSKNDLKLYFASNRPLVDSIQQSKDFDIWYVERKSITSQWGNPINIGTPVNTKNDEFYPSVTQNNNLYFTGNTSTSKGKDDIFYSTWSNNKYTTPISLSSSINTDGYEFNAYVSFDETYIIYSGYNRKDGLGSGDLYISFRDENKKWSTAINLGKEINSKYMDYCPFIDSNSMTLYFTSKRSHLKEINNFQSIEEIIEEINQYDNGMSRIYKVSFEKELNKYRQK